MALTLEEQLAEAVSATNALTLVAEQIINNGAEHALLIHQFLPYNPQRTYKTGEVCTIETAGEVIAMQMYAGPHLTCVNKNPADLANRHEAWADAANPFWWIPYTGTEVGMPFWWLDPSPPETAVMEINANLPIAVYWRLARRYPALVSGAYINTGEIRGEFLRVLDQGRGVDSGRVISSNQDDEIRSHAHDFSKPLTSDTGTVDIGPANVENDGTHLYSTEPFGGVETRPRNVARAMAITI